MTPPNVSVVIPAYNAQRTVGAAVDSVLAQTFDDLEVVVIDDGSTDHTAEIVAARSDPRLSCVTVENGGVARARNRGVAMTSAPLVAFLDADDLWLPPKLERQVQALRQHPGHGLCFASTELVDDELQQIGANRARPYEDFSEALLLDGNIVSAGSSSVLVERALLKEVGGFDPQLSQCADWDMWLRLSRVTSFLPLEEPLVRYRKVPGTMSANPGRLERDTFILLDKFFARPDAASYRPLERRVYARQWMVCSGTYLHAGRVRDSLRCLAAGLRADPRTIRRPLLLPARALARGRSGRQRR